MRSNATTVITAWVISLLAILLAPILLIRFRKRWVAAFNLAITNRITRRFAALSRTHVSGSTSSGSAFFVYSDEPLRVELDLDQLTGLFEGRYPLPFLNGITSRLC
jgi:hypothetical protein